jgi:hypothetical protein
MSEENTPTPTPEGGEQVVASDAEQRARSGGWVPKEEWDGNEDDWVDYREFNLRGELMERIQHQTRQLKRNNKTIDDLKNAIKALGEHNSKIAEVQYNRALHVLKAERATALTEGNAERVAEIEDNLEKLNEAKENSKLEFNLDEEPTEEPEINEQFRQWVQKPSNSWYGRDIPMTATADALSVKFAQEKDGKFSPTELLEFVDKAIRKEFPHKFKTGAPRVSESDASGTARVVRGRKFSARDLNDEQRSIGKRFVDSGAFSNIQEYVDQLAELGEIPTQRGA